MGEEGEKDRLRFFRMGEPAAEAAEEHGQAGNTDATPCAVSTSAGRALCVDGGASCTPVDDLVPLMFDRP